MTSAAVGTIIAGASVGLLCILLVGIADLLISAGAGWLLAFPVGGTVIAGLLAVRTRRQEPPMNRKAKK